MAHYETKRWRSSVVTLTEDEEEFMAEQARHLSRPLTKREKEMLDGR